MKHPIAVGFLNEDHVNRKTLILGAAILAAFTILLIAGSVLLKEWKARQPEVSHRVPLPRLGYCTPDGLTPCILSFTLDAYGKMAINVLTDGSGSDFHIKVQRGEAEDFYECRKARPYAVRVACMGKAMPAGEPLQFLLVSNQGNLPLAQGTFPIIGLALATPEVIPTPTFVPAFDHPPR